MVDFDKLAADMEAVRVNALTLPRVVGDFETASELKLGKTDSVGAWRYSEHHSTHVLCLGYHFREDGEKGLWTPDKPFPKRLREHIEAGYPFEAHNAQFEQAIWKNQMVKKFGLPPIKRWLDTMAVCAYRGLPLGLEQVGEVLNLSQKKDNRGKTLIRLLCTPHKYLKKEREALIKQGYTEGNFPVTFNKDPKLLQELYDYCEQDVATEVELGEKIGDLPIQEYQLWVLDQTINNRGVRLDLEAIEAAIEINMQVKEKLLEEVREITGGAVQDVSELPAIARWLEPRGIVLPNMKAETVDEYIDPENDNYIAGDAQATRLLQIRRILSLSSVSKYKAMQRQLCDDGRIRGVLQYHGAGTGRWAGRGPQFQNLKRAEPPYVVHKGKPKYTEEMLIEAIKVRNAGYLDIVYGNAMGALSSALRSVIVAAPGNILRIADFSAIEARVAAWLCREQWKLDAFYAIDRGEGYQGAPDIYCATASKILGKPVGKDDKERSTVGKPCELASGYQGWVNAWYKFDKSGRFNEDQIKQFMGAWRENHPEIVNTWRGYENAFGLAIESWEPQVFRGIGFMPVEDAAGRWLTIVLPNGRNLWYFNPETEKVVKYKKESYQSSYWGRDSLKQGKWCHIYTYGGKILENVDQATSRDFMVGSMKRVERKGYPIILTVHDEVVSEAPMGHGSQEEFEATMAGPNEDWGRGCPIAVAGGETLIYRKF